MLCLVCRHIVFWILIEILCSSYQRNWTLKGEKLFLASALHLFSKTRSDSGMIGENRCKAARRGHILGSRKRSKVKGNKTGDPKPSTPTSASRFMLIFFPQVCPVYFSCFLRSIPLPHVSRWLKHVCACMFVCCGGWHFSWLCFSMLSICLEVPIKSHLHLRKTLYSAFSLLTCMSYSGPD